MPFFKDFLDSLTDEVPESGPNLDLVADTEIPLNPGDSVATDEEIKETANATIQKALSAITTAPEDSIFKVEDCLPFLGPDPTPETISSMLKAVAGKDSIALAEDGKARIDILNALIEKVASEKDDALKRSTSQREEVNTAQAKAKDEYDAAVKKNEQDYQADIERLRQEYEAAVEARGKSRDEAYLELTKQHDDAVSQFMAQHKKINQDYRYADDLAFQITQLASSMLAHVKDLVSKITPNT